MNKKDLIKKSIDENLISKEEILSSILKRVHEERITRNSDIDIMILTLIGRKDMYGYEILKEIEIKSRGSFALKEGGVYPILHGLEGEGLLTSYWIEGEINKKYYRLTDKGREYISQKEESTDYNKSTRRALNLEGMGWK